MMNVSKSMARLCQSCWVALTMVCTLIFLNSEGQASQNEKNNPEEVTCLLKGNELEKRIEGISKWLTQNEEMIEQEDGYSFRFPGNDEWIERLTEFIKYERGCCNFLKFKLTFEPNSGPVWLYAGGSVEIKKYIETIFK